MFDFVKLQGLIQSTINKAFDNRNAEITVLTEAAVL
jgi:hypothetical protein